ncbi:MAG: capsular polysaccharide export protein, LipB/KpsS family [Planctomycetota bacterium]|jgi:hypothetical protein
MLIGFEFIWDETPLLLEVAKKLNEKGVKIVGVTLDRRWNSLLANSGFSLVNLADYLRTNWDRTKITDELSDEYENKYGKKHDLSFFINVDRLINDVNRKKFGTCQDKLKFLILHFKFWEEFFEKHTVDGFYTTGTAFLGLLTAMAVAQQKGIKLKAIYTTRESEPRVVFVDNYEDRWSSVDEIYSKLIERELTPEEKQFAKSYLEEFREKASKPVYMKHSWHISGFTMPFIKEFVQRTKRRYIYKWGMDKFDYVTPPLFRRVLKEVKIIVKRKILTSFYFKRSELLNERYIFFPLQLQPEESVDVWGKWHSNQIATVEYISKALPLNYKLYVKEHRVALGKRKGLFSYYERLKHLPNVVLIHPFEDTHKLIKSADLVIVISGTTGWEALLYTKPVITLGNVFYNSSGLVDKVKNLGNLKDTINSALQNSRIDGGKLSKYLIALRKGTHEGYFNVSHHDKRVMDKENFEKLAKGIYDETVH